jgi:uncharacterized membrane protein
VDRFSNEPSQGALDPTKNNVEAIARLEREALGARTLGERISDAITHTLGSATAVGLHLVWFAVWVVVNLGLVAGVAPFDPFPFGILTLLVSGEGVLLALFILISQNRMTRQADRRAHLALQVSLLAEQELTLLLQMQRRLSEHVGVPPAEDDAATRRLLKTTDVRDVAHELEERLPSE